MMVLCMLGVLLHVVVACMARYAHPACPALSALQETPMECPLCIETLDDTDRDFFPCPCG
jgi:hypothetical protein